MGIPLRSFLVIHNPNNDIRWLCAGRDIKTNLFVGEIWLYHDGRPHELLITTKPIFLSAEHAESGMKNLVKEIREKDLAEVIG